MIDVEKGIAMPKALTSITVAMLYAAMPAQLSARLPWATAYSAARTAAMCGQEADECDDICRHAVLDRRKADARWLANCVAVCRSARERCADLRS